MGNSDFLARVGTKMGTSEVEIERFTAMVRELLAVGYPYELLMSIVDEQPGRAE